jgi:predicted dehydrogenase
VLARVPDELWQTSHWRREHGGLWDVGPHALSLLLPLLGPVESVAAVRGPHRTTTVLLGHAGGAASTMTLSLRAPERATAWDVTLYGEDGWVSAPRVGDAAEAYGRAVAELAPGHPCDVHFARDVGAVLARAAAALD